MSAQSAKKKRIGSRRRVANQNKTTDADELHVTDSVSVVQPHVPEENTDSLNVLVNPDNLQSETPNPPSPELTTNRRKLGSSRRSKGGQRVKDSATESYHKPREEIEEKTRDDETPQTTRMSLAIQPQSQEELSQEREHDMSHDSSLYSAITPDYSSEVQYSTTNYPKTDQESFILKSENLQADQDENAENKIASDSSKLVETVLVGTTKADTLQSEELEANADLVGTPELTSLSVLSCATVDQQLIDQSESRKIPEELVCVYSVTEEENEERDKDAELSKQNGNLQGKYLVSESHAKSVVTQFSATPEITTDKTSPRENTKLEYIVELATFLSPNKELPKDEEQNEHFCLSEVSSEDAVNKIHEQEVNQTEMCEIDHFSESVTHDAAEKSEIISGNLIDQAEVSDTYQSELIVKSNDDSTTKQEDSNPDDGQDDHPTEENNFGALEHTNEDYHMYDPQKLQISGIERVETALSQAYEDDGQEGDDRKSNAKQTVRQEKQGLFFEMEESDASLQTVQSETNASVDSQPLQNDTGFNTFGNRRKLGSSRRNKGRQHFKEPVGESFHEHNEEVVEGTTGNKALETTEMSVTIERRSQEELSQGNDHDVIMPATHDSSLYSNMSDHSSEVQNPTTPNYPEVNLESLIPTSENLQEGHDDHDFKMEVSDKSVGVTSEGMDESDTVQEVAGAHLSEDAVNKVHGQEVKPTHDIDHPSESVTNDAAENSEIISENLIEQAEVSDTHQSELAVKSTDDSATRQEDSNPDDNQDEHPSKENNLEDLEHKNDFHVDYIKSSAEQTHYEEKEDTFSEMESESALPTLQSEGNALLDSQPLDTSVRIEEQNDTGFHPIGNRRKLGSSRRNKGRQQVKEYVAASYHEHKKEVLESIGYNEALERTQTLVTTERASQEELSQGSEHDVIMPATHDSSLYSNIIPDSFEVLNPIILTYPETDLESLIHTSENLQEEHDQTETDFKVEVFDESVEVERIDKSETLQSQEVRGAHHSEDAVKQLHEEDNPTQMHEMHGIDVSSQSMLHDSNPSDKQDEHPTEENNFEVLEQTNEDYHVHDTKKLQIGGIITADTALGQVYETEGRVENEIKPSTEQTVHREKEGLNESHLKSEDTESSITPEISTEKNNLSEHTQAECSVEQTIFSSTKEELPTNEEQDEHFNLSEAKDAQYSEDAVNKVCEQEVKSTQVHEIEHSSENVTHEATENPEMIPGNLIGQADDTDTYQSELILKSTDDFAAKKEDLDFDDKQDELPTKENSEALEHTNEDYHVYDTKEQQTSGIENADPALAQVYEIKGQVKDDIKLNAEQTVHQERQELFSEIEQGDSSLQSMQLGSNAPLDSEPQQEDTKFNPIGNRKKLGSSRRNKGRPHAKESESYHRPTEEVSGNTKENEPLETIKTALTIETSVQENSMETTLDGMDTCDSAQTEEVSDQVKEIPHVGTLGGISELSSSPKEELPASEEQNFNLPEVKGAQHSEDFVNKVHEPKFNPTQMDDIDHPSESVTHDVTENPELISANMINQAEVSYTHQSELVVKSTDDFATKQEDSNPDAKWDDDSTKEVNFKALEQTNEDYHVSDPKNQETSGIENEDTALGQVHEIEGRVEDDIKPSADRTGYQEKEGIFPDMEESEYSLQTQQSDTNAPLDFQPLVDSVRTEEQTHTGFNPIGNRRKLGSSRRNKGRQQVKGSVAESSHEHKDVLESTRGNETLETTHMLVTTEKTGQEELIPKSDKLQEDHDKRETDFKVDVSDQSVVAELEGMNKSNTPQNQEVRGAHHSEDAVNKVHEQEVNPTQMDEMEHFFESVTHDVTENPELISANMINQAEVSYTHQSELVEKSTDDFATKQEDSNPDAKWDDDSTKEVNFKALEQTNGDYHVSDPKKQETSDIENEDTALGQVHEIEGRVEDDIKPSAEQTGYQEKEGIFPDMEESEYSLQTQQSDTNAPLDFQPLVDSVRTEEQTHTGFNPIGNRRKLGSSRRNKGRQQVKGSVAESSHGHADVLESTRGNETLETTHMVVTIDKTSQEELSQEHKDGIIIPVAHDSSLYSTILPDSSEIQNPTSLNYPEAVLVSLIPKSDKLQEDHDKRETDFKVDVSDQSVVAELEGMNKSNTPQNQEVRGAHHSEDAVNKVHEQEVNPTQMDEMEHFFESVTHDVTENPELISSNMINQAEVSYTHQSELVEKCTDDFATKQEDSSPDAKRDDDSTKEVNFKALEQTNEDCHVSDPKKQETSGIENEDTALSQVHEIEGRVEDDIKPSAERTGYQEKEGSFPDMEESEYSLQTQQSDTNAPLDFQPLVDSVRTEEQTHTGFNPIGNRRKLGSSRRNKGRQQVKGSVAESSHEHKDVLESTRGNETLETTHMLVTTEKTGQEELIPKSDKLQEDHDKRETDFKVDVSDQSVVAELEGMNKSNTPQSQEIRGAHHSEDAVNKVHEQEVNPTQMDEIDHPSESVSHDVTENPELISANMINQVEASDTHQSESVVKSADDFATKQEDSSPDAKRDDDSTKEVNFKALEQTNEDCHVSDPKNQETSGIENEDTALSQVHEIEGRVEDDIKPSAERTGYQEKEGIFPDMEESEYSLQTQQSDTNAPLDFQPLVDSVRTEEQTHTGFNPIGNRRKLGSSRRNKGRQQVKGSVAESSHGHADVLESTRGNETLETTHMVVTIDKTSQEELSQEHKDGIIIPVAHDSSLYSTILPDSSEIQNPTSLNYPEAVLVSLIPKSDKLQEDHDKRETDFKVDVSDQSVVAELEGMNKSNTPQNQEVRGAHHSEDAVNKVHEQEVNPTQMDEMEHFFESVTHDVTENPELISSNMINQAEVSYTHQSELVEKCTDDFATKQEDSSPDAKRDDDSTKEVNFKALEQTNEDCHVSDPKKQETSGIENEDTALSQVHEIEGRVEDDIKPSAERTGYQEKEGSFPDMEESEYSLQTQQSDTNAPLDFQPLVDSVRTEEQTHTGFNPIGNRRKLGSSRRNKGRQQVKGSVAESSHEHKDVLESTRGNETLETTHMLVTTEKTGQEELIPKSDKLQEDHDKRETDFKVDVSDQSVVAELEGMNKSNTPQSQEIRGAHHSEDAVNKVHEQEVNPTQMDEIDHPSESVSHDVTENPELISANMINQVEASDTHQSESVVKSADDFATKQEDSSPDAKRDDDSTKEVNFKALEQTNEDCHVSDPKNQETSGIENEDTALSQVHEIEGRVEDDIKPSAERTGYQEKEGIFPDMEESEYSLQTQQSDTNAPLDFQPLVDSVRTEEQTHTGFNPIGNRRKLGSSRRNKGRQQVKGSVAESSHEHKDVLESTRGNETLETTHMLVTTEKTGQEELIPKSDKLQEDHDKRETDFKVDVSDQSVVAELEGMNKSNTPQSQEIRGAHHSEDAVNNVHEQEVNPTQMDEIDHPSESVSHDVTENPELISANMINQVESVVKSADDFATKQDDSNPDVKQDHDSTKEDNFKALEQTNEDYHVSDPKKQETSGIENEDTALGQVYETEVEDDIKPSAVPQEKQGLFPEMEEGNSPSQTLQSEINALLDSQPLQNDTNLNPIGNRRKLGSSRRNKGRQHAKDSAEPCHKPAEEVVGNTRDNELLEITEIPLAIEAAGIETCDTAQTEVSDHVKENAHVGTFDGISELTTSLHSSLTVDHQIIDQSNSTEMPEQELPNVFSVTARESNERDKDTELLSKDGNLQDVNLDLESSMTPEITTEKSSPAECTDIECSGEQAAFTSPKEELSSKEEQKEPVNLSQVRGTLHSEDVLKEVYEEAVKPTQTEEIHQIDKLTFIEEGESSLQTLQSEMNAPLDSQPLDTSVTKEEKTRQGFNPTGNRRKLGSSRRNKGRQHVKDPVTETYHKPEEEFAENTRSDEVLETTNRSLATETMKQEELKMQTDLDLKPTLKTRKKRSTISDEEDTENVLEEDGNTIVTRDITSSPGKDDSIKSNKHIDKEENNLIKEPENFSHLTGHDTVKMDMIQSPEDDSDIQTNAYHDDKATTKSVISELLAQEDAHEVRNTDALSCDKDSLRQEINVQQTKDAIETVGDVKIKDHDTGTECSMNVQVFGQDEAGEKSEEPAKKDHDAQEMDTSVEITHAEPFSAAHSKTDAQPAVYVHEESGISIAVIQEKTDLDDSENLPEKSKQKRRKMGSTRRIQLKKIPEEGKDNEDEMKDSDFNMEADMNKIDKMEAVEELPMTVTAEVPQNENVKSSDLHSIQSHLTSDIGDLTALLPGQPASHNEDVVDSVKFVQVTDMRDREKNADINVEPSQVDITYVQNDEDRPESANVIQDQALKSAEASVVAVADLEIVKSIPRGGAVEEQKDAQASIQETTYINEEAHTKNLEMKNASPNLNSPNRRRKMGSSRRSLGSRRKEEDLHQKQQVDNEATEAVTKVGDVKTASFPSIKEKEEPQLHTEDKDGDSEQRKEKVFETVEYSHTGKSHFNPPSHQTFEESPASQGPQVEMEPQLTPSYVPAIPSTSPEHDVMSEIAGGRRRKMGSHRKSRVHQNDENQTTGKDIITDSQNGRDVRSVPEESAIKTNEEESLGLDRRSEVDEGDKKPSSNISTSNAGELLKPVSAKTPEQVTPVQQPNVEIHLGKESQKTLSLAGSSGGTPLTSKRYNVMMVGDSSVGKTSFMKRAQSGKFSLDLPASVGLDSCMWTVVVDGKPVVLQLWDTAGQERFHSITRQIFHKAQAFLLMYDITSSQSFAAVSYWANCIQEGAAENVTILLIGNKSDCAKRQVKTQEGEILAKEYNFEFMECSAATGENVIQSLETVARMLSQKVDTREETMVLHKEPQQKKSSGCC